MSRQVITHAPGPCCLLLSDEKHSFLSITHTQNALRSFLSSSPVSNRRSRPLICVLIYPRGRLDRNDCRVNNDNDASIDRANSCQSIEYRVPSNPSRPRHPAALIKALLTRCMISWLKLEPAVHMAPTRKKWPITARNAPTATTTGCRFTKGKRAASNQNSTQLESSAAVYSLLWFSTNASREQTTRRRGRFLCTS